LTPQESSFQSSILVQSSTASGQPTSSVSTLSLAASVIDSFAPEPTISSGFEVCAPAVTTTIVQKEIVTVVSSTAYECKLTVTKVYDRPSSPPQSNPAHPLPKNRPPPSPILTRPHLSHPAPAVALNTHHTRLASSRAGGSPVLAVLAAAPAPQELFPVILDTTALAARLCLADF
jgi:hypothetical protein